MLKSDDVFVVAHKEAIKHSFGLLKHQPWSSFMTIVMIAVTLMMAALCGLGTASISELGKRWQQSEHVFLYLQPHLDALTQARYLSKLRAMPEVATATLTTAEEGLQLLSQQEGMQDVMQYLPQNPLPAVIDILPNPELNTPKAIQKLFQILKKAPEVEEAKLDMDWLGRLYTMMKFLKQMTHWLMGLFAIAVMLVIGNTLRLIIHHRHEEIQVLQFLGAKDQFIMRPFLYTGVWYGLFSAILAIIFVDIFMGLLGNGLNKWAGFYQMNFNVPLLSGSFIAGLVLSAMMLGWLSARMTLRATIYNND